MAELTESDIADLINTAMGSDVEEKVQLLSEASANTSHSHSNNPKIIKDFN
jgi:hypothetical protein